MTTRQKSKLPAKGPAESAASTPEKYGAPVMDFTVETVDIAFFQRFKKYKELFMSDQTYILQIRFLV